MADTAGFYGQHRPPHLTSPYMSRYFMADQLVKRISTATLMQVKAVTNTGDVAPIGTMDAVPMVNMVDGANNISKHGTVFKIAYCRLQGGTKAVIMDPSPGDIGLVVMCDRDTSVVRKNKSQSNPGSRRRFDVADGVWVMTMLSPGSDGPTSYWQFRQDGTIIGGVKTSASDTQPCEMVIAKDHVQMKKHGVDDMHITVDVKNSQLIVGMDLVVGPDPYPND